ncbi:DUF2798 domain-containing protein [Pseudoroseicyclus sp. H15]
MELPLIPVRYAPILFGFFLSVFMSCLVAGIATLRNVGFVPDLFGLWGGAWFSSWIISFPVVLVVAPIVRRLVARLTA